MGFTKAEAIVLKTKSLREADALITLFTREHGKVQAVAKSLRKPKSRYGARLEMFTHNQVMLFQKTERDLAKITGCAMIHSFYSLRESFFKYSMASYFLELVDQLTEYNQPNHELFLLLGRSLGLMEARILKTRENYLQLWNWFALQILELSGFRLSLDVCVFCRVAESGQDHNAKIKISLSNGGFVCSRCVAHYQCGFGNRHKELENTLNLSLEVWLGLRALQKVSVLALLHVSLPAEVRLQMKEFLECYVAHVLGYPLHCREFFMTAEQQKTHS